MVLENHGFRVRGRLRLLAEEGNDGFSRVVVHPFRVEAVQQGRLFRRGNLHVVQQRLRQHARDHGFVTLQELGHQLLGVFARVIFRFHNILSVTDIPLDVNGHLKGVVIQPFRLHRLSGKGQTVEQRAVPSEHRGRLQSQVIHHIAVGVCLVLPTAAHLLLIGFQEVKYRCLVVPFGIYGQCPDQHSHRMRQLFVGTPIVNRAEQCLLLIVVLRQQIAVSSCEESALVDAVLLAVGFHLGLLYPHLPRQFGLTTDLFPFSKNVAQQWAIHVTTIKVFRIPLLIRLEVCRLTLGILRHRHLSHRFFLRLKRFAAVGLLDIGQQYFS